MSFAADYPGAIVVEAAKYGYEAPCRPKAWCLHTPEELADSTPSTPYYFHNLTDRNASTTYFVSYPGFVFQCVPEGEGAYANALEGKPRPAWASEQNLNLQTLSIEIEGYAHNIHQTMPRGSPQWKALVDLMAHRCKAKGLNPDWTIGHYQVSIYRSDPGTLDIGAVVADVKAKLEEDDMDEAEVRRIVRDEISKYEYAAYDGNTPKSGKRRLATWAWGLIRHEQTAHGGAAGYTDADAVKAVREKLGN